MQIAALHQTAHPGGDDSRTTAMAWVEAVARVLLIAIIVLIGAAVVRNVTDTLTAVTRSPAAVHTASLTDDVSR